MPLCSCLVVEKSMLYQGGQEQNHSIITSVIHHCAFVETLKI